MKAPHHDRPVIRPLPAMDRARQVTDALADYVEDARLQAGDRLPAERELMAALGVGRSTIREAIRHFQALGVIETRKGSGTYLLKPVSKATIHMPLSLERDGSAQMPCCRRWRFAAASSARPAWWPHRSARPEDLVSSRKS
jgi:GntR family transcriptional repressor for pyruvate dehydrogenase complex